MSTKTTIQTLINTNLADSSNITAFEHRAVENALLNELYPTVINETHATTNTVTAKNTNLTTNEYSVSICKQGRVVTINGTIINNSNNIIGTNSNHWFFEIINSEYFPLTTQSNVIVIGSNYNSKIIFNISEKKIYTSEIQANGSLNFTLTYFTEN